MIGILGVIVAIIILSVFLFDPEIDYVENDRVVLSYRIPFSKKERKVFVLIKKEE